MSSHILYLLHFERPLGKTSHYMGITAAGRIRQRLAEHQRGFGSSLTRAALRAGITITCARLWPVDGYEAEQAAKKKGHFKDLCPVCRRLPLSDDVRQLPVLRPDLVAAPVSIPQTHGF